MAYKDPNDPRIAANQARYRASPKGRANAAAQSASPARLEWGAKYRASGKGKESRRINYLMTTYGLDRQQAQVSMVSQQGGFCACCGKFDRLVVDHNHTTGTARSMVCQQCNTIAGGLESPLRPVVQAYLDAAPR